MEIGEDTTCSVVIPVYNAERFIASTLKSVINQTVKNIEIICVDDNSSDNSVKIIEELQREDSRIILLKNIQNLKVAETRNRGVHYAHSPWVAFLDADDMWEKSFLEKMILRQKETGAKLLSSSCKFMRDNGKMLESKFIIPEVITYRKLLKQNKILCSSVFVDRSLLLRYPFENGNIHEDYLCWLNILKDIGKSYSVVEPLLIYRLTKGSKSRNKLRALGMSYRTYRRHGLGFFKSLHYTSCNAINGLKKYLKINGECCRHNLSLIFRRIFNS